MTDKPSVADIGSEDDIQRLLSLAGPRLQPPPDVEARVRAATMAAVERLPVPEPERARWQMPVLPLAAAVALSLIIGLLIVPDSKVPSAGEIVFASGAYTVRGSESAGHAVAAGSILRTSTSGRMLVDLGDGRTLRMDQDASLTLRDASEIWLHRGRIYLDSAGGRSVTVVTDYASVSDVGTQFEVAVEDESLVVSTREGIVNVRLGGEDIRSTARPGIGEALKIDGLTLMVRESIPTTGSRWAWTQRARPLFSVQNRTYREYLEWNARESGKTLKFESPLAAQQAGLRTLLGTGDADADAQTLSRVLATSLVFETLPGEEHEIIVGLREVH